MDKIKTHAAGCRPHGDQVLCIDPPQCFAPARWVCAPRGTISCTCELPPPTLAVQSRPGASVVYGVNTPSNPALNPMEPWCDAAGVELALAVMLARLLGAPH